MYRNIFRFVVGLIAAGMACLSQTAYAALMVGDAVGADYKITAIDAGVSVDFAAHASVAANANTIGKLTVTMSHGSFDFLGFTLKQNAAATEGFGASGGLRLLLDVKDTNGMTVAWTDYHIRAVDSITIDQINAIDPPPNQNSHLIVAHFHDTPDMMPFVFASSPLVLQGNGDNVKQLNFGLGMQVNPGAMFTASNILLHERNVANVVREFRVEFVPSVPEPTSLAIFLCLGTVAGVAARFRRR